MREEHGRGGLSRRGFIEAAAAAALVPSLSRLGLKERGARWANATTTRGTAGSPSVTVGGAPVRPPSVPLAVRTPYVSTWLPATELTATTPQFWFGSARGFVGLARIDGQVYAWAGQPQIGGAAPAPMTQSSLEVTATRSVFTMQAGGVQLVAEWLSPIEPGNLRLQSVPLTLLTVTVSAVDSLPHNVQIYADLTGEWASSNEGALIQWQTSTGSGSRYWSVQLQNQQPLTENTQMAQWGTAIWATSDDASLTYQSGSAVDVRNQFAGAGTLAGSSDPDFRAIDDNQPVFAFARDLGSVTGASSALFAVGHARTPAVSYGPQATPLTPLWTRYWPDWQSMTDDFLSHAAPARQRAIALDSRIENAATRVAGPGYSAICALAARQCYGGTELVIGPQGTPWLMGKEISSDGDVNTVDIFDQAFLMWLYLDPGLVPLVMEPILDWCASSAWQDPSAWAGIPSWQQTQTRYCVHDLGVYPVAKGRVPGNGEQMPIEEAAGMLIMAAAYAGKVGAAAATPFLAQWKLLWGQWAEYLLTQVPAPATQLTTDDWAPIYTRPTGSVNLGVKALIGLAAAGQIATLLGDTANAARWSQGATGNVEGWVSLSTDPSGQHLNLEQGASGTWSSLYNAYYELVIGTKLVPEPVAAMQAGFYMTQLTTYGMGLQTATDINKVAWLLYLPAWLRSYQVSQALLDRDVAYINDTPSLVPYGDRYDTGTGVEVTGVKAHPTLGAVFALLAAPLPAEPDVNGTQSPYPAAVAAGGSVPIVLTLSSQTNRPLDLTWAAQPPAGISMSPAGGSVSLAAQGSATVRFTVSAAGGTTPQTYAVPVVLRAGGTELTTLTVAVAVAYPSLSAAFNNVGITDDADHAPGNFDGVGNSFSAEALAAVGITPGATIVKRGVTFTWPGVPAGTPDNVAMQQQVIALSGSGGTLGILGAGANGTQTGSGTLLYADGTMSPFTIAFADWINSTPAGGDDLVATTAYFNRTKPGPARTPSLFAAYVPLPAGKALAAVILPSDSNLHAFDIAVGG